MVEILFVIISIVLIASGVGLLIQPHIDNRTVGRYFLDEQRHMMTEAEALH